MKKHLVMFVTINKWYSQSKPERPFLVVKGDICEDTWLFKTLRMNYSWGFIPKQDIYTSQSEAKEMTQRKEQKQL